MMTSRATSITVATALVLVVAAALLIRADLPVAELQAKYTHPASKYKRMAGTTLHYRDEGTGTPVVLLHGTAASLNTWDAWASELSKSHRVLRLDLPGFGLTGPNATHTYSIAYYSDLLLHLLDTLGIEKAHLAGSSLGGQIAYDFAANHPKRVQKLILVAPTGVTNANDKNITLPFRLAQTPLLKHTLRFITPRFIVEKSLREVYGDDSKLTGQAISMSHDMLLREGNRAAFLARLNTADPDNLHKLAQVQAPTLILWGETDAWVPVTDAVHFQQNIRGARVMTYPGAGHIPMEEIPQQTVEDVLAFLAEGVAVNRNPWARKRFLIPETYIYTLKAAPFFYNFNFSPPKQVPFLPYKYNMSKAYFISGLGADWRMFQFLKLPEYIPQQYVEWVEPRSVEEPLHAYVHRLLDQITDPDPILVGMSYGGLVAIELSKILHPRKTILISSLATHHALPAIYRAVGKTHLHRWMPLKLMQRVYPLAPYFFGAHTRQEKQLLRNAILHIDEKVLRWSLGQLLEWPQEEVLPGLVQIHGTHDRILPLHDRPDIIKVQRGEHLMVMHQADEISAILSRLIEETWTKADTSLTPVRGSR